MKTTRTGRRKRRGGLLLLIFGLVCGAAVAYAMATERRAPAVRVQPRTPVLTTPPIPPTVWATDEISVYAVSGEDASQEWAGRDEAWDSPAVADMAVLAWD